MWSRTINMMMKSMLRMILIAPIVSMFYKNKELLLLLCCECFKYIALSFFECFVFFHRNMLPRSGEKLTQVVFFLVAFWSKRVVQNFSRCCSPFVFGRKTCFHTIFLEISDSSNWRSLWGVTSNSYFKAIVQLKYVLNIKNMCTLKFKA